MTQAHAIFLLWWHRIVPYRSYVKGWKISPRHYLNRDLATVWLDKYVRRMNQRKQSDVVSTTTTTGGGWSRTSSCVASNCNRNSLILEGQGRAFWVLRPWALVDEG